MDILLKAPRPADLIALYQFYAYTATWQQTQTARCTVNYVAKGLGWSERKVARVKAQLVQLGLIEDVRKVGADGRVTGWYIRVRFLLQTAKVPQGGDQTPKCLDTGKEKCKRKVSKGSPVGELGRYPTEEEFEEWIERHNLPIDYHGNFFAQMETSGWTIKGKPVVNWKKTFIYRLATTHPNFEKEYGTKESLWEAIEQADAEPDWLKDIPF